MSLLLSQPIPLGWHGGFAQSNPQFSYPDPNLSSLPMSCNMDNIDLLQRQMRVKWPEFSWETKPGESESRCFQRFAEYISQIGYTNEGRVYSIICPQQGLWLGDKLCLNVEVAVTGQRGWVDEVSREMAADMTVEARVWFTHGQHQGDFFKYIWNRLGYLEPLFPIDKKHAIRVTTFKRGDPDCPIFPVRKGENTRFDSPQFSRHQNEAWTVANLDVEIGPIKNVNHPVVDEFNSLIMHAFNLGSGNLLQEKNVLTWNVWFTSPQLVSHAKWRDHAEFWRDSIDVYHCYPYGSGTSARYYDGTLFSASENAVEQALEGIWHFVRKII
jgi:hypothetical protein